MEDKKVKEQEKPQKPVESVKKEEGKMLTQEQFDKTLSKRLSEEKDKIAKETEEKIKEVQAESERIAKLSADEKARELEEKAKRELDSKMVEVSRRENRLDAIEKFTEAKVPANLVDYVLTDKKDSTLENADKFIETYNESVSKSVADQLKGNPPKDISDNSKNDTTDKEVVTTF